MAVIKPLEQEVIEKIAAGEVIERPASVVKELVENALDAGASQIQVKIEESGLGSIEVHDNGEGMSKEDLELSIQAHTTSKLETDDDLLKIGTFGFRGEALSSIVRVAHVVITSRREQSDVAYRLTANTGDVSIKTVGAPTGTSVSITRLFESAPVRKKFFKTPASEYRHIIDVVTKYALSFPTVGFSLSHNGNVVFSVPFGDTLPERMRRVYGSDISPHMISVSHTSPYCSVYGFIGVPQTSMKTKSRQHIFVNSRAIKSSMISKAVKEAYGSLLEPRAHPIFVLNLEIPYEHVDVNYHPRKETIRFAIDEEIRIALRNAVIESLEGNNLMYGDERSYEIADQGLILNDSGMSVHTAHVLRSAINPWNVREDENKEEEIIQVHDLYLIAETPKGIMLIDQHAAHERILYEQFLDAYKEVRDYEEHYVLKKSVVLNLPIAEAAVMERNVDTFAQIGFELEHFGGSSFKVTAVPDIYKDRNIKALISEVLEDLAQEKEPVVVDSHTDKTLSYLACRTAIKAGDTLTPEERRRLVRKLFATKTHYTCPHGRPVMIELSKSELEKMFKRR